MSWTFYLLILRPSLDHNDTKRTENVERQNTTEINTFVNCLFKLIQAYVAYCGDINEKENIRFHHSNININKTKLNK